MVSRKKTSQQYDVDRMMQTVALSLTSDFQSTFNDYSFGRHLREAILTGDVARIRQVEVEYSREEDTQRFKAAYQLSSVFKRYRFRKDIYSDEDLVKKAVEKFLDDQLRVKSVCLSSVDREIDAVLDIAASFVARILGPYDGVEHRAACRFGRKASVGIPARKACEAARWEVPITGSVDQISWFHSEMSGYEQVMDYLLRQLDSDSHESIYQETDHLVLTLVPKTFKSFRCIMPNTTIGSYMSYGLGDMMRKRLKRAGYDISHLQMKHREIAQRASIHEMYVTADLSSASDSISVALVKRLFPSDWYSVLDQSRIGKVKLPDGQIVESQTFCTMGIGYTFPLQTLVFLSILFAIQALNFERTEYGRISVYGDDLIYHRQIHKHVIRIFPQLGFVINEDKTFADGPFRESCGGDYHCGVDVRPFQPRNGSSTVGARAYEAVLYKYINGLLMRWSEYEIPTTLAYLCRQLELVAGVAKLVPQDFPDDSGIKGSLADFRNSLFLQSVKTSKPKHLGHGVFRFSYLRLESNLREENRHEPYLWLSLGSPEARSDLYGRKAVQQETPGHVQRRINSLCTVLEREPTLIWKECGKGSSVRSKLTGRRLRRMIAYTVEPNSGRYTRQSGTSRFEDRR